MAALRVTRLLLALGVLQAAGRSLVVCVNWNPESVEIARGKPIVATSTCGAVASEKYCYSTDQGSVLCGFCTGDDDIESATDGQPSYWQSSVLSGDALSENVNITINLIQKFHIRHITITTAFTPQPAVWIIERSRDQGNRYTALKYFVTHAVQCTTLFGLKEKDIAAGLCVVQESTGAGLGEKIDVSLNSTNEVIADHLRLRYIQLRDSRNLGEFDQFSNFYTLKEISVKGIPYNGNGNAHKKIKRQACYCSLQGTVNFICTPPGQVCPCKISYSGKKCNKCSRGFYDYPNCFACDCSEVGSMTSTCKRNGGQCRCKPSIDGRSCSECRDGFYGFANCTWCGCNKEHTTGRICDESGKCFCKENYDGESCEKCSEGYSDYPLCMKLVCACSEAGSFSIKCNVFGQCECKRGFTGPKCERCTAGFYGYPNCKECGCHYKGSIFSECDSTTGRCVCYPDIGGRQCDRCVSGQFGFPNCRPCVCNPYGIKRNDRPGNTICPTGREKFQCQCKKNVGGSTCEKCKDLYYKFSPRNPYGCRACGCFKAGTIGGLESCDQKYGHCACKSLIEEGKCHECRRGYHSLNSTDIFGCTACKCNPGGAQYGNCDKRNGKCRCRRYIGGFTCDRTIPGSVYFPSLHHISVEMEDGLTAYGTKIQYKFDPNEFPSFSWKGYIQFSLAQPAVVLSIVIPRQSIYRILFRCIFEPVGFPLKTTVRFAVSPTQGVPGYTRVVSITLPSTRNGRQERSALMSVSNNNIGEEFLMFKGKWTITVSCDSPYLLMDYLVFMPEEYYGGTILEAQRLDPCLVNGPKDVVCDRYTYPDIVDDNAVKHEAENGYFSKKAWQSGQKLALKYYSNSNVLKQLGTKRMVVMNKEQNRFALDINIPKTGRYVFIVHYYNPSTGREKIDMYVHRERGAVHIGHCVYQFGCRQVVMKDVDVVKVFELDSGLTPLNLFTSEDANIAIDYVVAIPYELWHPTYIIPALVCRSMDGKCISSKYEHPTIFERQPPISKGTERSLSSSGENVHVVKFSQFFNKLAGDFYLVIQFNQTTSILVDAKVSITTYSTVLQGVAKLKYCPNTEFCRVLVETKNKNNVFGIPQGTTSIEIRFPVKKDVALDWFYIIPSNSYSSNVLSFKPYDHSKTFIERCSRNNYLINPADKGYCMQSSFALTTHFNKGALRCACSYYGARSGFCNKAYGQCMCRRPNIIGRQCSRCSSGYYGFPYCRRCACDPKGVDSNKCGNRGRCKCKQNFAGIRCNRCKSGFFGFPACKACNCNVHGSLSSFCTASGQCQCRRSFDGKGCAKCRIGFFGFPECKECNCHAAGIKPLANLPSGCNSSNAVKCTCKDNVYGQYCDTCKDFYYNLQFNNPKGCQSCRCNPQGTISQFKNCDKVSGQCPCKPNIDGMSCTFCKDGSTALRDYSIFGCKGCECDYGGSWDNTCNKRTGACLCRKNVAGKKCTRVKSHQHYAKDLHHVRVEFENGTLSFGPPVTIRHSESEFPGFSGRGYIAASGRQTSFDVTVYTPRPTKYRLLIRYVLDSSWQVLGQVTISPTKEVDPLPKGYASVQVVSIQFKPTATRTKTYVEFLTVTKNGKEAEFFLSRGKWRISVYVAPSKLLLDYLVMIPEEYYKATHLRKRIEKPCTVDSTSLYCVEYKYLDITEPDVITVPTTKGQLIGPRTLLPYTPFKGVVLSQVSQLYLEIPIRKLRRYVLMVTYYQETKTVSDLIVGVRSPFTDQTARIRTYYCKYTFGCRQPAVDDTNKVIAFNLFPNARNVLSIGAQSTVAVKSVTIIPQVKWNLGYTLPAEHCVKTEAGCMQTTYQIHKDAVKLEAEKVGKGVKPSDALDSSVRAVYLAGDGVSLRMKAKIEQGRYKILVNYYQSSSTKYTGRIIVESGRSTALSLSFKHCPNVGGCHALGCDKVTGMGRSIYIIGNVDVTISTPLKHKIWIDYILFVPIRHYSPSMENQEPVSLARKFISECGNNNFIVDKSSSQFCKNSAFTMATMFNLGASSCDCHPKGSTSSRCDAHGGQCQCKPNVVGRRCDQCKGGTAGFPNCRRV